jgi:two-component system, NarL family, response regulator YdfI
MIKILIADDHLIIRQGLRLILETEADFEVVGEACDGSEALEMCREIHPDIVLMDLRMPNMDGLTAIEKIHTQLPDIALIILTTFNEDDLMVQGLQAGARSYLLKDTDRATLIETIRAAERGETLLKREIMDNVLSKNRAKETGSPRGELIKLTPRELEVLEAIARGDRSKEVAFQLGISERTIKAHLASIYNKLGVDSRAAAISVAMQKKILKN